MMIRQARPSAKIIGFDTHMILEAVPAQHANPGTGIRPSTGTSRHYADALQVGPVDPHPSAGDVHLLLIHPQVRRSLFLQTSDSILHESILCVARAHRAIQRQRPRSRWIRCDVLRKSRSSAGVFCGNATAATDV